MTVFNLKEKKATEIELDFKLPQYWVGTVYARQFLFLGYESWMRRVDPKGKVKEFAQLTVARTGYAMAYWRHKHSVFVLAGNSLPNVSQLDIYQNKWKECTPLTHTSYPENQAVVIEPHSLYFVDRYYCKALDLREMQKGWSLLNIGICHSNYSRDWHNYFFIATDLKDCLVFMGTFPHD